MKVRTARIITALLLIAVILVGALARTGLGTVCSFGSGALTFTCPLGFLQLALASKSLLTPLWPSVGLSVLAVALLGRFFCAWGCPTRLLHKPNGGNRPKQENAGPGGDNHVVAGHKRDLASYARYAVLGGALVSSFIFGFPVFCLICPVGLFFGSIWAVVRLFWTKQLGLELVLFPAMLGFEILVLKRWCRSLCPLGALLGLIGSASPVGRPKVEKDRCLVAQGTACQACWKPCPEGIDLVESGGGAPVRECTRCLECYARCPRKAIRLWPFRK